jgi:hypothetical protein
MEGPIIALKAANYKQLVEAYLGASADSYAFEGQFGYQDHVFASAKLASQVTGVVLWHINANEPRALDYDDYNQPALYNPDAYPSSEHDPSDATHSAGNGWLDRRIGRKGICMARFESHTQALMDRAELAAFTDRAYRTLAIPYKYGSTLREIERFLTEECPDFVAVAREEGRLAGWAGVYHWTESMAYFLSWHPLVLPPNPEISQQLVRQCIQYTQSSGREWTRQVCARNKPSQSRQEQPKKDDP